NVLTYDFEMMNLGDDSTHDCEASGLGSCFSLLMTPLCGVGTYEVTPYVSASAWCNGLSMFCVHHDTVTMSHASSPRDSYNLDYDPSEHSALDIQPQTDHFAQRCPNGYGNQELRSSCYECESLENLRNVFPRLNRAPNNNNAGNQRASTRGRVHVIGEEEVVQNLNVVTGMDRLTTVRAKNDCFAKIVWIPSGRRKDFSCKRRRVREGLKACVSR
nr:reverse transcriptase domain-containing protein [Tanacetum cinerariifolium]